MGEDARHGNSRKGMDNATENVHKDETESSDMRKDDRRVRNRDGSATCTRIDPLTLPLLIQELKRKNK